MTAMFSGPFADHLQNYVEFKASIGYSKEYIRSKARTFDLYTIKNEVSKPELDEGLVTSFVCDSRDSGSATRGRCEFIHVFAEYLANMGLDAYILPVEFYPQDSHSFMPHIFTEEELSAFFREVDRYEDPKEPFAPVILSTCFRLTYTCGLRPAEMRSILVSDVDLQNGQIYLRKTKTKHDRIVVMSEAMTILLEHYMMLLDSLFPNSEYLFPDTSGRKRETSWFQKKMKEIYSLSNPQSGQQRKQSVRVYDLRHQFATTVVANWLKAGENLENKLPYLQTYMGHINLSQTMYYVHLQPKHLLSGTKVRWAELDSIIPEVPND